MGFAPHDVDLMALWEIAVMAEGWNQAHGSKDSNKRDTPKGVSDDFLRQHGVAGF